MKYVYILKSVCGDHYYVGMTGDVERRLIAHNSGQVSHTSKHKPWHLQTFVAFSDEAKAAAFEQYLKSGSGRAFATKRL